MNSFWDNLKTIAENRFGRNIRKAIHDGLQQAYEVATNAQNLADGASASAKASADVAAASASAAEQSANTAQYYADQVYHQTPAGFPELVSKVDDLGLEVVDGYLCAVTQ